MTEQVAADGDGSEDEDVPEFRVSHLMDELADAFADRDRVELVAPLGKGGIKPRVSNRVTFSVANGAPPEDASEDRRFTEDVLETERFSYTVGGEPGAYVVLGREIQDLRELRKGDRIHLNKRRGPFKVYRVLEQPSGPEVLQRSASSVTVEVSNVDTGTDWMVVHWKDDPHPWAYVKTADKSAKGGYRYRKVEQVERSGRIGPRRLFAPPADATEDVERHVPELLETARDRHLGESRVIHPTDLTRVEHLFKKPIADVFTPDDADHVRTFLTELSEWYERQANGLEIETDEDRERARENQEQADLCSRLADAFNLLQMDAVDITGDVSLYVHTDCGKAYTDRFAYSKHCGLCDAGEDDEQDGEQTAANGGE
jgi:hypothetical protein